jgi:hypothetical protein
MKSYICKYRKEKPNELLPKYIHNFIYIFTNHICGKCATKTEKNCLEKISIKTKKNIVVRISIIMQISSSKKFLYVQLNTHTQHTTHRKIFTMLW